jgi:dephospho-CoA kinase
MIIGLTGTFGAGKGELSRILMERGYAYHSCSDILRAEIKRLGQEETIENLAKAGNRIREESGPGELARRIVEIIRRRNERMAIVDSIRSVGEVEELRKNPDFVLISVEAPVELRYQRIKVRGRHGDNMSFDEFKRLEGEQVDGGGARQNLRKCMADADFKVSNYGTIEELRKNVESILAGIEGG